MFNEFNNNENEENNENINKYQNNYNKYNNKYNKNNRDNKYNRDDNRDNRDNRNNKNNRYYNTYKDDDNKDNRGNRYYNTYKDNNRDNRGNRYYNTHKDDNINRNQNNFINNKINNNKYINNENNENLQDNDDISDELIENSQNLKIIQKWDELNIDPLILRGIYSYGFEIPSPIQSKAIIPIIEGYDIIAQSQSGTGKTATFCIGALSKININDNNTQILIISPTHELTNQITNVINNLSSMMIGIKIKTIIGGSSINDDIDIIKKNTPHIIVGCPGRIYDMIKRDIIQTSTLKLVILDEADELLSISFKEQIYEIFKYLNNNIQIALFSATLPNNIYEISKEFMNNPIKITIKTEALTLEGIKQYYITVNNDYDKYITLKDLYQIISVSQCIIYANSIKRVSDLYDVMKEDGFPVCCIHSKMDKFTRDKLFTEFKNGSARVLISSNITARGIDIQQVSCVINFDIPNDVHTYLHRIGRSGRWGRKGTGINFITQRDIYKLKEIEKYYSTQIEELPIDFNIN